MNRNDRVLIDAKGLYVFIGFTSDWNISFLPIVSNGEQDITRDMYTVPGHTIETTLASGEIIVLKEK